MGLDGPVPARVSAEVKQLVIETVGKAVADGFTHRWATSLWGVSDDRVHRWRHKQHEHGSLEDSSPGGGSVHSLLPEEIAAVLELSEQWGPVDRSHRKLAHRGSYLNKVWVSPSTLRRVLAAHSLVLPKPPSLVKRKKTPWPDWLVWEPNRIWIWDVTHFSKARRCVFAIEDMVSRRWITTLVSPEETSTQTRIVFDCALETENLDQRLEDNLEKGDTSEPVLLAVSDNGAAMTSRDTKAYMTALAIAQHHGRPGTPTDQAWIESFFGHIKCEWPHLTDITDPVELETELDRVRHEYNNIRLHQAIGYVTPNDEHYGKGDKIRQARREGLEQAKQNRINTNRKTKTNQPTKTP